MQEETWLKYQEFMGYGKLALGLLDRTGKTFAEHFSERSWIVIVEVGRQLYDSAASFICIKGGGCAQRCLEDCVGKCHLDLFVQYSPCSYGCIVDGKAKFLTEPDFTYCGTEKVCYQGRCRAVKYEKTCKELYGEDYIGLADPYNSCNFQCISTEFNCKDLYDVDVPEGTPCFIGTSSLVGKCISCICVTHNETEVTPRNVPTNAIGGPDFAQSPKGFVSFGQVVAQSKGVEEFQIFGPVSNFISFSPRQWQGYLLPEKSKHSGSHLTIKEKSNTEERGKASNYRRRYSAAKHDLPQRHTKETSEDDYEDDRRPKGHYDSWDE